MPTWMLSDTTRLVIEQGDITRVDTDAIVNAANSGLMGGGGVDGAIHRAAGRELLEACRQLPKSGGMRCPPGEARITPGFKLKARHVIHTVGPIYREDRDAPGTLAAAHRNSLLVGRQHGLRSIAFPAISCGVYGYPLDKAAAVALRTVREATYGWEEIRFVLYGPETFQAWDKAARAMLGEPIMQGHLAPGP